MTTIDEIKPPEDYQILVPRDWFRIDLTIEGWRPQLKKFVDLQAEHGPMPAETRKELWRTLRNTAEDAAGRGALELFLRTGVQGDLSAPATLLVSLLPLRGELRTSPADLSQALSARNRNGGTVAIASVPAGTAVHVVTDTTQDFYFEMPGGVGYLLLAFSVPLGDVATPMGELCKAIAASLRWV
ncbi:hypothetical protein ACFYYR_10000 [Streptomyces sp. NPDC001922]|uniref:hypothetical protein n=1 Tax=Streptomyces sp. NPDC001922 TaxID=3364624 RepID=UPI00369E19CA